MRNRLHVWVLETGPSVIFLTGFALIVVGVVCLFLSDMVAARGSWWQGTLGAFGVGSVVGGLVDVMGVTLFTCAANSAERRYRQDIYARSYVDVFGRKVCNNNEFEGKVGVLEAEIYFRFRTQTMTLLWVALPAGLALIVVGVVCLFLSDMVAARGSWWQGTLGAFGVGFVIGGLVDVMGVALLNRVVVKTTRAVSSVVLGTPGMRLYVCDPEAPSILGYIDDFGAIVPRPSRLRVLVGSGRLVSLLAGLALMMVGVVCLFLPGMVAASGWWQGTLGAFGVGSVVGGLVDVVAVSLLDWAVILTQRARRDERRALGIRGYADESGALRSRFRLWVLGTGQLVSLLAGFALMVVGVVCLFLSGMAAARGSWQGTLDAFGVGFVVGGLVDVVAVSLLDWAVNGAGEARLNNWRALDILGEKDKKAATELLATSDGLLDDSLREELLDVIMNREPPSWTTPERAFGPCDRQR